MTLAVCRPSPISLHYPPGPLSTRTPTAAIPKIGTLLGLCPLPRIVVRKICYVAQQMAPAPRLPDWTAPTRLAKTLGDGWRSTNPARLTTIRTGPRESDSLKVSIEILISGPYFSPWLHFSAGSACWNSIWRHSCGLAVLHSFIGLNFSFDFAIPFLPPIFFCSLLSHVTMKSSRWFLVMSIGFTRESPVTLDQCCVTYARLSHYTT